MSNTNTTATIALLGGQDLEMRAIKAALHDYPQKVAVIDRGLGWGAKLSAYADDLAALAAAGGGTAWAIELELDIPVPEGIELVVIDHHGDQSHKPAALLQVLALVGREPSRWEALVAANDSGYIPGLVSLGATPEEIKAVRGADRAAQGVSPELEAAAEAVLSLPAEMLGQTRLVRVEVSKCSPITDRLAVQQLADGQEVRENLLIVGADGESNFFGPRGIVNQLAEKFGGWSGGGSEQGYWGGYAPQEDVMAFFKA